MSNFPRFIVVFHILSSFIIAPTTCLEFKTNDIKEYNDDCFYWIQTLESINLILCNVDLDDLIVERSVGNKTTCILDINLKTNQPTTSKSCHDFVIFTDSRERDSTEDCVLKATLIEMLSVWTKLIICDKSPVMPQHLKQEGSLKFLGSTNALYVTKSDCWSGSPFYFLRRSFSPAADCSAALWVFDAALLPDMMGKTVRAVTFDRLLFSVIDKNESDPTKRYDGVEVKIFLAASEILNFTWDMEELGEDESNKWGIKLDGNWKGGVMQSITSGKADLILAAVWISDTPDLDYSYSWSSLRLRFLVPRPTIQGSSWTNLAIPFQGSLWLSVAVFVLSFPLIAWSVERLYMINHQFHRQSHGLSSYVLYTAGSLTGGSANLASPRSPGPIKPLVASWYIIVLLLYACYTSKIASILSIPSYEPRLDTVRQLVEQNFSWGRTYYVGTATKFVKMEDYWQRRLVQHYVSYNSSETRTRLLSRKFALYVQELEDSHQILIDSPIDDDLVQDLRLMREGLMKYWIATGVRQHSPLKHSYDRVVVRLIEHGFIHNFKTVAIRKYQKSSYQNFRVDPELGLQSEPTVLALDDFKYIFYILVAGCTLSSACFVLELYVHARSNKLKEK